MRTPTVSVFGQIVTEGDDFQLTLAGAYLGTAFGYLPVSTKIQKEVFHPR